MRTATTLPLSRLPDRVLLARTRQLVDRERHLHVDIIDHLREIEDRDLHLARGFSTLFDYAVNELGYSSGAVWRRTLAMRLCRRMGDVRERLQTGSLTLSTAAQLQSAFERQERKRRRTWAPRPVRPSHGAAASTTESMAAQEGKATGRLHLGTAASPPESAAPVRTEVAVVLDATGQRELVKQATGKSSRQVEELIASVDPSLATPREQLRARGDGRWTFTVVVDQECRHALNQLKSLMSHVDPAMSYGQLVNRLVQDELRRPRPAPAWLEPGRCPAVTGNRRFAGEGDRAGEVARRGVAAPARQPVGRERDHAGAGRRCFDGEVRCRRPRCGYFDAEPARKRRHGPAAGTHRSGHPGRVQAGRLGARPGTLLVRRSGDRTALHVPAPTPDRPHPAVGERWRLRAAQSPFALSCASPASTWWRRSPAVRVGARHRHASGLAGAARRRRAGRPCRVVAKAIQ